MTRTMLKRGDRVKVYGMPATDEDFEDDAVVVEVGPPSCAGDLRLCRVIFPGDSTYRGVKFQRWVSPRHKVYEED